MIPLIQNIQQKHQLKKTLFAFLAEMEKNLETFYVIDQRQFITYGFSMGAWADVKELSYIKKHESISVYARALEEFNALYKAHKEFEQWYSTDLERKTSATSSLILEKIPIINSWGCRCFPGNT